MYVPLSTPIRFSLFILAAASSLFGQTTALRGVVTDVSGALIPNASVTATSVSTGAAIVVKTGADGTYIFPTLTPGDYTVQAAATNLVLPQPVRLSLTSASSALNLQLRVAATAQQVTVRDNIGPSVGTEASNNASALIISGDALDALADDPDDLQADLQALAGPGAGPGGASIFVDGFSGGQLPRQELDPRNPPQPESVSRRNTTSSASAASRSSPSRVPTPGTGR